MLKHGKYQKSKIGEPQIIPADVCSYIVPYWGVFS